MKLLKEDFKFIDLFSGIGGFHIAMNEYSNNKARCIIASEINSKAIQVYKDNFNMDNIKNILDISGKDIEDFDVLCAGFPCQSFSKAGNLQGFNDDRGILFNEIERIISEKDVFGKKPKILILENVKNLVNHDNGNTWKIIKNKLINLGYNVVDTPIIIGPSDVGVAQLRDRAIILGVDSKIYNDKIDIKIDDYNEEYNIQDHLLPLSKDRILNYSLKSDQIKALEAWDFFIKNLDNKKIGFPIWSDYFFNSPNIDDFPQWKKDFINKNIQLYKTNKKMIDKWRKDFKIDDFIPTYRKFEWQAGSDISSVFKGIIQFRPSGIRVKRPNYIPTLVAMKHIPVIGSQRRFITEEEALKFQSFPESFKYSSVGNDIYRLLGNAVNVKVIHTVFQKFIDFLEDKMEVKDIEK